MVQSYPLDALRIAHASLDLVDARRSRLALLFAANLGSIGEMGISSSEAVLLAGEIIDALQIIAGRSDATVTAWSPPLLRRRAATEADRVTIRLAFRATFESGMRDVSVMVPNAWIELFNYYLNMVPRG